MDGLDQKLDTQLICRQIFAWFHAEFEQWADVMKSSLPYLTYT